MTTKNLLDQLTTIAEAITWPGGDRVLGSVVVSPREPASADGAGILPALVIQPLEGAPAGEHTEWHRLRCKLHVLGANANDEHGEAALLDGAGSNGLARIANEVASAFGTLTASDGVDGLARLVGGPRWQTLRGGAVRATFDLDARYTNA